MARNDCYSAESFYFCGVKTSVRQEVAGNASVFRADNLLVKYNRNEWGNSNIPKGFALMTLTARIAVFYLVKILVL